MQKIMFNDTYGLTAAVIERRKTNTRRTCKEKATNKPILANDVHSWRYYPEENIVEFVMNNGDVKVSVPPYKVGEVVSVAQCYEDAILDVGEEKWNEIHKWYNIHYLCHEKGLHNKMFVRADLMPHQILITGLRIERLQDISNEDCLREGIYKDENGRTIGYPFGVPFYYTFYGAVNKDKKQLHWTFPREAFSVLIDKPGVGGKGTWNSNPYVFAYTFELVK